MKTIDVPLKDNPYKIIVGERILHELGAKLKKLDIGTNCVIITNPIICKLHGDALASGLKKNGFLFKFFEVAQGEQSKSAKTALNLVEKIARYDGIKDVFIIAFGGGVVGDLAGYIAAAYKRGIPYIQVPTTFLAQIDSAIGGKVAIDLPVGKNLLGAFHQPKIVYSDVGVLSTLDARQIRNGLAEAVKYGMIADKKLFVYIEKNYKGLLGLAPSVLKHVVVNCSRIKASVVTSDERETKGIRTILNFGHTVGHAVETAGSYNRYHHGEAIALGMRVAAQVSEQIGILQLKDNIRLNQLLSNIGLPQKIKGISIKDIFKIMQHDKKFKHGKNRFVLARAIGKVEIVTDIAPSIIRKSIQAYLG